MSKITVDLDGLAFNSHGQQIGIEIPEEYLDQIRGGLYGGNLKCGDNCAGSVNEKCGNNCFV